MRCRGSKRRRPVERLGYARHLLQLLAPERSDEPGDLFPERADFPTPEREVEIIAARLPGIEHTQMPHDHWRVCCSR